MYALPILILGLAAGIYLLMKATREYLGNLFKALAWLVIVLSLGAIVVHTLHGIHQFRHRHDHPMAKEERIIIRQMGDSLPGSCCMMAQGCQIVGDSVIVDRAFCEKMMGKESCDKICNERGKCILSKDECIKMCGGDSKCMMNGQGPMPCCAKGNGGPNACCINGGGAPNACCTKGGGTPACCTKGGEMKECCKKK